MAKRRARLNEDNDPLNPTDKVLAGFEQAGKLTSQEVSKLDGEEVNKLGSEQVKTTEDSPVGNTGSQLPNQSTSQVANQSASYKVDKPKLKKSTFQINEAVLEQLDKLHLQLQLEMGKGKAPYKEVIVEEAISQLLQTAETDRDHLVELLVHRQAWSRG